MKHRTIIFPVILHPPSQDGIEHPRQVFQGFVAPQLEFPASDFLSDGLCSFVAYSRQEAHEVFPPVVSSITLLSIFLLIGRGFRKLAGRGVESQAMAAKY